MTEIIAAFIGAIVTIVVWYFSSYDLRKRDRENKKLEIRLQFLVDAYRNIEFSGNRSLALKPKYAHNIESAIGDIQLFGSRKQVKLAQEISDTLANDGKVKYDDLLNELRRDLRNELSLELLEDTRRVLRINEKNTLN